MFTGLVADLGRVVSIDRSDDGARLAISSPLGAELAEGDSVAVNGVCLTATAVTGTGFEAEVMNQTLLVTSLGRLRPGGDVNLELPLRAADRLGGHVVQGHVDGAGEVSEVVSDGFARRIRIDVEPDLMRYLVTRGSIAVDGVSLTVAELDGPIVYRFPDPRNARADQSRRRGAGNDRESGGRRAGEIR